MNYTAQDIVSKNNVIIRVFMMKFLYLQQQANLKMRGLLIVHRHYKPFNSVTDNSNIPRHIIHFSPQLKKLYDID
jgi:hypothetical protein